MNTILLHNKKYFEIYINNSKTTRKTSRNGYRVQTLETLHHSSLGSWKRDISEAAEI
jgi:hypothetical protein